MFRSVKEIVLFVCGLFENRGMNSSVLDVYGSVEKIYGCVGNFVSEFIDVWLTFALVSVIVLSQKLTVSYILLSKKL